MYNHYKKFYLQVQKKKSCGSNLYVSLSVDDIAIRRHVSLHGTQLLGYEDFGGVDLGGGPRKVPASHAMVMMITPMNASWKVPCGYFLISDKFSGKGKADNFCTIFICKFI